MLITIIVSADVNGWIDRGVFLLTTNLWGYVI